MTSKTKPWPMDLMPGMGWEQDGKTQQLGQHLGQGSQFHGVIVCLKLFREKETTNRLNKLKKHCHQ
jgi:hypothetical protein